MTATVTYVVFGKKAPSS
jgi:hypothetical protein